MKNVLKKLRTVRLLLRVRRAIKRKFCKLWANICIYKVLKCNKKKEVISIGFIVQLPAIWDKQSTIYSTAKEMGLQTYLFVVEDEVNNELCGNYFIEKYPEAIKLKRDNGELINIKEFGLDYLFYPRPYDVLLPKSIRSDNMKKYVKCCYVPYGFFASDSFNEENVFNPFFDNMYLCFMDSVYMQEQLCTVYRKELKKSIKKFEYLGYPVLEQYLKLGISEKKQVITWTPRWSYDTRVGGSNFLEYRELFLELCNDYNKDFIFRPHPLMFNELIKKEYISKEEAELYLKALNDNGVMVDYYSPINDILAQTDVLITDFSTIIGAFFMTGRPIIYCNKGITLNPIYQEISKYIYIANSWEDVLEYYKQIVIEDDDYLLETRLRFISENYDYEYGADRRIVQFLIDESRI